MTRLQQALAELAEDLGQLGARWALVGGLALAAHVEARTTRDLDVAVSVEGDREAEHLVRELRSKGYREHTLVEQEKTGRLATVRFAAPGEGPEGLVVDLLFASCGIEPEIVAEAETLEILPGLPLPVARVGHLLAMKLLAGRPRDMEDAGSLLDRADASEMARAWEAVHLVTERGYDRDQDLELQMRTLLAGRPRRPSE
jgi:predicted nucleotidyltransferase